MKPINSRSVVDLASTLKTSVARVYQMIHDKEIKATNIGRGSTPRWVVLDEDFEAYHVKLYGVRTVPAINVPRHV